VAKIVDSVALDNPAADPAIGEGGTFTMDGTATLSSNHNADYDAHYQFDQGTGTWIDIPSSGSQLTMSATNPATSITGTAIATETITAETGSADTYSVRIRTVDHVDGDAEDLSNTQTVTVSLDLTEGDFDVNATSVLDSEAEAAVETDFDINSLATADFVGFADAGAEPYAAYMTPLLIISRSRTR